MAKKFASLNWALSNLSSKADEAWPEGDRELENGFKIAILKRSIDACVSAIASCNTLELEDDGFEALRSDVFVMRDAMIDMTHELRND